MALLEETNVCAICENKVMGTVGGIPRYFCQSCYEAHKEAIFAKSAPWLKCLLAAEKARRKRRGRRLKTPAGLPIPETSYQGIAL